MTRKIMGKRGIALCMLLACIITLLSTPTAYALDTEVKLELPVSQVFTNTSTESVNARFAYELTAKSSANPMPQGSTLGTYKFYIIGTDTLNLSPVIFTQIGVYEYEIKQVAAASVDGYTYDASTYTIEVYVGNNTDGSLMMNIIITRGTEKTESVTFTTTYTTVVKNPNIIVDPPVSKSVVGEPTSDGHFTFKLEAFNPSQPMPIGSVNGIKTTSIRGSGEVEFGTWAYTAPGRYTYYISEVNNAESGYTYDTAIYTIVDIVSLINGQYELTRTITNNKGERVSNCSFVNKYKELSDDDLVNIDDDGLAGGAPQSGDIAIMSRYAIGLILLGFTLFIVMLVRRRREEDIKG